MSRQQHNLLWLKDLLEHLQDCQQQLEWAHDQQTIHLLIESMLRDLESCRQLCVALKQRCMVSQAG